MFHKRPYLKGKKMKYFFIITAIIFFTGCASNSQILMNQDTSQSIRCASTGWGILGVMASSKSFNDCVDDYKKIGYVEIEKIPTSGFGVTKHGESPIGKMNDPAVIVNIIPSGPAYIAGMRSGDIIIMRNKQKINCIGDLLSTRNQLHIGDSVTYTVLRNNSELTFTVLLVSAADLYNKAK